jgi:hypothetical protein
VRYLLGFLCVCSLGGMPLVGCSETGGNGGNGGTGGSGGSSSDRFEIFRGEEEVSYSVTVVVLREEGPERVLFASSSAYDDPNWADDEMWYYLRVVFDAVALADLETGQEYPISGEASWTDNEWSGGVRLEEVIFASKGLHTAAIEQIFFGYCRDPCWVLGGTETIRGALHLTVNDAPRLAGTVEVRVEGDVQYANAGYEFYEVRLVFDQNSMATGTDAGTDAGTR